MRFRHSFAVGAILVALTLMVGACGDSEDGGGTGGTGTTGAGQKGKLTVGAFNFSESNILAHMYAGALRSRGYDVTVRDNLGTREVVQPALEKGEIDVGLIFTSDGAVSARGFVVLDDDKKLQPAENVIPAIRTESLTDPIEVLLNAISKELTTEELSELNKSVDIDKADPADVANDWLVEHGFLAKE